ncbi:MAG: glycoside hydrolase family 3 C-terminal domain-containing protein [Spirochaetales bacterium]|nr:glycoside hydrolase family 3 C-terminal domain-containing protein [Spirochaetales bacterium]
MDIKKIIEQMTLEEKAGLCSGADFWKTKAVERLDVPPMMVSDGPHGLRKQDDQADHAGINESIKAVCFPTGVTVCSSFDKELIREMGENLGEACQAENLGVLLGPAVNIKRSPLCGRNFEYFSEDPFLSAEMATAQIQGIQSQGVGTSIKHYLANSQEHRRMSSDSRVDERTLREIYLPTFEKAVKEAQPWTVMCSYNRINGTYASESHRFLTEVLRDEWGFEGFVVSDWGAVNDRVEGLKAGLDLEMPSSFGLNDAKIVRAVKTGKLDEAVLDKTVERILKIVALSQEKRNKKAVFDREAQHGKARQIAGESMVLLKNEGLLPLQKKGKVAFVGAFAQKPRFQGGGSSHINTFKESSALQAAKELLGSSVEVSYAPGYSLTEDCVDKKLIDEAVAAAAAADCAVVFAGLPDNYESEGYDRSHMRMPESHDRLIEEVAKVQKNVVVVLHNGSPVEMPWLSQTGAVLEAYLSGQAVGEAVIDILFGDVNPSGKLAETFPVKLEDNPSYLYYIGEKDVVEYREGIFVGYRYYDKKNMDVLFPFGHGLSYTTFEYEGLKLSRSKIHDTDTLSVTLTVKNTGSVYGKEAVQLYVTPPAGDIIRPNKELKGFEKIGLKPGESKRITFTLDKRSFAYYNTTINDWYAESGDYGILVGSSSRDIRLEGEVSLKASSSIPWKYDMNSLVGDILKDHKKAGLIKGLLKSMDEVFGQGSDDDESAKDAITDEMKDAMFKYMPIRNFACFGGGLVTFEELQDIIYKLNEA